MPIDDFLSSGLSLERPETSSDDHGVDTSSWGETPGFSAGVSAEEVNAVTAVAMDPSKGSAERFEANHLLGVYYSDRDDLKRALYHIKMALSFATTHAQKTGCYFNHLLCQLLMDGRNALAPEDMPLYDKWVEESLAGILDGDAAAILGALDYAENWEDYGLAAAAALAWSTHPENTDAFDREEAEASYHRYKKQLEEQKSRGFPGTIYMPLSGERSHGITCRAKVRLDFLNKHIVHSPEELLALKQQDHPADASAANPAPDTKSPKKIRSDELMAGVERFARRYSQHARSLYSAKPGVLRDYIEIATPIVRELKVGNVPLMRALINNSQVFEDMQDYMLLSAAATLWLVHPENTDGREQISAQKKSVLWMETSISLSEQFGDHQPLEWRLQELRMPERGTCQSEWLSLAQHVRDMVSA